MLRSGQDIADDVDGIRARDGRIVWTLLRRKDMSSCTVAAA